MNEERKESSAEPQKRGVYAQRLRPIHAQRERIPGLTHLSIGATSSASRQADSPASKSIDLMLLLYWRFPRVSIIPPIPANSKHDPLGQLPCRALRAMFDVRHKNCNRR